MAQKSTPIVSVELQKDAKIILDQLLRTDRNVTFLHPLIDLLSLPDDQKESLGESLAQLLKDLTETCRIIKSSRKK